MGLIRKVTSVSTLGLIDFRSDKERTASYTRSSARQAKQQTRMMQQQLEMQQQMLAMQQHQAAAPQQQPHPQQQQHTQSVPQQAPQQADCEPGWFQYQQDPQGVLRWYDGTQWTDHTNQG